EPAEHRFHPARQLRPGMARLLRERRRADTPDRRAGAFGCAVRTLLRAAGLRAEPDSAADRALPAALGLPAPPRRRALQRWRSRPAPRSRLRAAVPYG